MNTRIRRMVRIGAIGVGGIIVVMLVMIFADRVKTTVFTGGQGSYPPPLTVPLGLGVDVYFPELPPAKELSLIHDGGFRWIRTFMKWKDVENTKGVYDFSFYDKLFNRMNNNGIQPYIIVAAKNDLYKGSPLSDKGQQGYIAFAQAIATHYKGQRIVWEMMNEPNTGNFWENDKPLDPVVYGKLVAAASKAMRQADPNIIIVGPTVNGSEGGLKYLDTVLQQGPAQYWNAISVHPYRNTPEEIVTGLPGGNSRSSNTYDAYRGVIQKYAPSLSVMAGEVGWSTDKDAPRTPVNRYTNFTDEAKYIAREYLVNLMAGVSVTNWFNWKDNNQASDHADQQWKLYHGIMKEDLTPKPAYTAIQTLTQQLDGFTFARRILMAITASGTNTSEDYVLMFTKDSETKFVVWTSGATHTAQVPIGDGCYQSTDYMGKVAVPYVAAQQGAVKLSVTDSPQYLSATKCFVVDPTPRPTGPLQPR